MPNKVHEKSEEGLFFICIIMYNNLVLMKVLLLEVFKSIFLKVYELIEERLSQSQLMT